MATAKEFLARVNRIEGVDGCFLARDDGKLLGHLIDHPEMFSSLLTISVKYARDVKEKAGFSYCRLVSFERKKGPNFHIFSMDKYFLGIAQSTDIPMDKVTLKVNHLLSLVQTRSTSDRKTPPSAAGHDATGGL